MRQIGVVLRRCMRLLLLVLVSSAAFILVYILRKNVLKSVPASEENETITLSPVSLATPTSIPAEREVALEEADTQSPRQTVPVSASTGETVPSPGHTAAQTPEVVTDEDVELATLDPTVSGQTETIAASTPNDSLPADTSEVVAQKANAETAVAYCVKCRTKREMLAPERSVTKNGRSALVGQCPVCGTKLFRFITG